MSRGYNVGKIMGLSSVIKNRVEYLIKYHDLNKDTIQELVDIGFKLQDIHSEADNIEL